MECEKIKEIAPKYIAHTASETEASSVEEHLCICHDCRQYLSSLMDKPAVKKTEQKTEEKMEEKVEQKTQEKIEQRPTEIPNENIAEKIAEKIEAKKIEKTIEKKVDEQPIEKPIETIAQTGLEREIPSFEEKNFVTQDESDKKPNSSFGIFEYIILGVAVAVTLLLVSLTLKK